jgi:hypothetical protein
LSIIQDKSYKKISSVTLCNFHTGPTHARTHNISKIQLKFMYGFCRITDLGKSHFKFSSKNYSSKVYTCLVKVVVLVTQSRTKLCLHFLDFYMIFARFSHNTKQKKNLLSPPPLEVLDFHKTALASSI